ncbi:alpha/beta hydrolase [Rugosimonospora acidiphila]|uniref:Alpha/beta hydrolase n=1 Tax=Rugosimonospora acidiphila TaxID=556531 RepID=A0ABP9S1Y6_9ACTN
MTTKATLVAWHKTDEVRNAVLLLPGGSIKSRGRYWSFVDLGLRALARTLSVAGEPDGLAVYLLRYRYRGWNGEHADALVDTREALDEIRRRHGSVPVSLVGNSLGGRAAFHAADDPSVTSVVGVAPWLPEGDPVDQLAGRRVLIMHGERDRSEASAASSLAYARRARAVVPDLARFEVGGDGHYLLRRAVDCWALTTGFVTATVGTRPLHPAIGAAMAAQEPDCLNAPLAVGFGGQADG